MLIDNRAKSRRLPRVLIVHLERLVAIHVHVVVAVSDRSKLVGRVVAKSDPYCYLQHILEQ